MIPDKPYNTSNVVALTGIIAALAWIGTIIAGFNLYGQIPLGSLVIVISAAWLVVTVGTAYYIRRNTTDYVSGSTVWQTWFWLSIVGIVVNILAGVVVEAGFVSSQSDVIQTAPMQYGVILPWMAVYALGNLMTAFYNWEDKKAISTKERVVYALLGGVSLVGTVGLALTPSLHSTMIELLVVLSLAQIATVFFRR